MTQPFESGSAMLGGFGLPSSIGLPPELSDPRGVASAASGLGNLQAVDTLTPGLNIAPVSTEESSHDSINSTLITKPSRPENVGLKLGCLAVIEKDKPYAAPEGFYSNVMSLADLNNILAMEWQKGYSLITQGSRFSFIAQDMARSLARLGQTPESMWGSVPFYQNLANAQEYSPLESMTLKGILKRYNMAFPQASDNQFGTSDETSSKALGVCMKGLMETWDYWGIDAKVGSKLYLIIKRKDGCKDDPTVPFAVHPYVSDDGIVPLSKKKYFDLSGKPCHGAAIHVGVVQDVVSNTYNEIVCAELAGLVYDYPKVPCRAELLADQAGRLNIAIPPHARLDTRIIL